MDKIVNLYSSDDLLRGTIVKRINRFVVEVSIDGLNIYAHNSNTGRLEEYLRMGMEALLLRINGYKLKYRIIAVRDKYGYALIDTISQSKAFEALIELGYIPWLGKCRILSRNPKVLNSRLDYLIECSGNKIYVETKSAVLRMGKAALYPDCPSIRGRRHIKDVIELNRMGFKSMIIFISALPNIECFKPNASGDEVIYKLLGQAYVNKVDIKAIALSFRRDGTVEVYNPDLPLCKEWIEEISMN